MEEIVHFAEDWECDSIESTWVELKMDVTVKDQGVVVRIRTAIVVGKDIDDLVATA